MLPLPSSAARGSSYYMTRYILIVIKTNTVFQDVFRDIEISLNRHFHGGLECALIKCPLCYVISLNSGAKPIESLSDCRWLAELETEGLSSIAKERLFDTCYLGERVGSGFLVNGQE